MLDPEDSAVLAWWSEYWLGAGSRVLQAALYCLLHLLLIANVYYLHHHRSEIIDHSLLSPIASNYYKVLEVLIPFGTALGPS